MRRNVASSLFCDKTVKQWFDERNFKDGTEALEAIQDARMTYPDFAIALKYVSVEKFFPNFSIC